VGTAKQNGDDILLMTTPEGMRDVFGTLPPAVGLLMDVAHLAVSARTLGFDPGHALADVADLVGGYHLSENDGTVDSNQPVRQDSWFWDGLTPKAAFVTLEINPDSGTNFADQVLLAEAMLDRNSG
jgi:sugar phosphate isomerase/epimerase